MNQERSLTAHDESRRMQPVASSRKDALISVVIPCYNYARYLPDAVRSVLCQDEVSVEVIIVDDASSDDSVAVAASLAAEDSRVRLLRHPRNLGAVATFNDGLKAVSGQYVVRLDADDLLTPGSLRRSLDLLEANPSVGLVYGHPVHFSGDVLPQPKLTPTSWTVWPGRHWVALLCRSGFNVITSPEVVMRRAVVDVVGGQQPLAHTHDMEMWLRIAAFSDVGYISGADQAWHREHGASLSRDVDYLRDIRERLAAFETLLSGIARERLDVSRLSAVVHETLAAQALEHACHQYDRGRARPETIQALVEFAREVFPASVHLPQWRALSRRRKARAAHLLPWYVAQALLRRLAHDRRYRHWSRWGIYSAG